ncbi:MAG: hypothetical protein JWQ40_1566 [Segetibacter sp.]|nr:hypothetical protein [Segetibacter sp.]
MKVDLKLVRHWVSTTNYRLDGAAHSRNLHFQHWLNKPREVQLQRKRVGLYKRRIIELQVQVSDTTMLKKYLMLVA